jgi:hypothetical protein
VASDPISRRWASKRDQGSVSFEANVIRFLCRCNVNEINLFSGQGGQSVAVGANGEGVLQSSSNRKMRFRSACPASQNRDRDGPDQSGSERLRKYPDASVRGLAKRQQAAAVACCNMKNAALRAVMNGSRNSAKQAEVPYPVCNSIALDDTIIIMKLT